MTKYLPLVIASILLGMALMAFLVFLLVLTTGESTEAQIKHYGTDCGDICRGA